MRPPAEGFLEQWHVRCGDALADALAFLAEHEETPYADGVLGDWVRTLAALRFEPRHTPFVLRLLEKRDPWLKEAGLILAPRALGRGGDAAPFEDRLVALLRDPELELWVLEAVVGFLGHFIGGRGPQFTEAYRELVSLAPPSGRRIARNRFIDPLGALDALYEQHALQSSHPTERDRVILPVLEARYRTRGWRPTVERILERMGLDPEQHWKALG